MPVQVPNRLVDAPRTQGTVTARHNASGNHNGGCLVCRGPQVLHWGTWLCITRGEGWGETLTLCYTTWHHQLLSTLLLLPHAWGRSCGSADETRPAGGAKSRQTQCERALELVFLHDSGVS